MTRYAHAIVGASKFKLATNFIVADTHTLPNWCVSLLQVEAYWPEAAVNAWLCAARQCLTRRIILDRPESIMLHAAGDGGTTAESAIDIETTFSTAFTGSKIGHALPLRTYTHFKLTDQACGAESLMSYKYIHIFALLLLLRPGGRGKVQGQSDRNAVPDEFASQISIPILCYTEILMT